MKSMKGILGSWGWNTPKKRFQRSGVHKYGYGSIPIDTFLVGWTSIYQLFWGSLGTRVLTHPHMGTWSNLEQHEGFRYFMCLSAGSIRCANISSLWFYGDQSTTFEESKAWHFKRSEEIQGWIGWGDQNGIVLGRLPCISDIFKKCDFWEGKQPHLNAVASNVAVAFPCVMLSQKSNGILVMFPHLFHLIPSNVEGHELETLVPKILLSDWSFFSA